MATKKSFASTPDIEVYRIFESNLDKLAYFVGTTETWYEKQVRVLGSRVRKASEELDQVEAKMDELGEESRLAEADERRLGKLMDRADDLADIHIFMPLERKLFRQFPELVRVLGLLYLVAIFESYLVDIVREILLACPDALKSGRQLSAETIIKLGKQKQIISYLAEKEVEKLPYKSFPHVVSYFGKKFNINLNASGVLVENIVEILATRNIHVHNRGIINQLYLELVRGGTLKVGAYKPVTREYLRESIGSISALVEFVNTEVQRKYFAKQDTRIIEKDRTEKPGYNPLKRPGN